MKITILGLLAITASTVSFISNAQIVPVLEDEFSIAKLGLGSGTSTGVTSSPDGGYAIIDASSDEVYIVDKAGAVQAQFDTFGFGAASPSGIARNTSSSMYAIVDNADDEIYIVNYSGFLQTQFDTAVFGSLNPTGITYNNNANVYAICDASSDEVYIVSPDTGLIVSTFDTGALGITSPNGISYNSNLNLYAITDNAADDVFFVNEAGVLVDSFDIATLGSANSTGITYDTVNDLYQVTDSSSDILYPFDANGTLVGSFSTAGLGLTFPTDISINPSTQELVITDSGQDVMVFADKTGLPLGSCSTTLFNSTDPTGIVYLPFDDLYAITDRASDEVYIVNSVCLDDPNRQFDVASMGSLEPAGIAFDRITGDLVISDITDDTLLFTHGGELSEQRSVALVGSLNPVPAGVTYIATAGHFVFVDSTLDRGYVINRNGGLEMQFSTAIFGSIAPTGIAFDDVTGELLITDSSTDTVYILSIPRVLEARSLTGEYQNSNQSLMLNLTENSAGYLSGVLDLATGPLLTPGYYDSNSAEVMLSGLSVNNGISVVGNIVGTAESFDLLVFPPPLGILERKTLGNF